MRAFWEDWDKDFDVNLYVEDELQRLSDKRWGQLGDKYWVGIRDCRSPLPKEKSDVKWQTAWEEYLILASQILQEK